MHQRRRNRPPPTWAEGKTGVASFRSPREWKGTEGRYGARIKLNWVMEVSIILRRELVGRGLRNSAIERRTVNREDSQV